MRVILVPARLRLAAVVLFACVPIAALETIVVTRAPWWRLPYRSIGIWSGSVALICLPLSIWLMRGLRWSHRFVSLFFAAWIVSSAWVALRMRHPSLGFFTVAIATAFVAFSSWLDHELKRSFFDPGIRWYEGLPRPVPGLRCRVAWGDRELDCQVGRIDREGAFVFRPDTAAESLDGLRPDVRSELTFMFREQSLKFTALPMRALDGDRGAGFQFDGLGADSRKQLGDFIENLKGEGYAI
jgi:hypothetical protein